MHGPLPEATPVVVGRSTNQCHACFNFSRLRSGSGPLRCTLTVALHQISASCTTSIFVKYLNALLIDSRIDTRVRNAVTLVWGSLRLAPTTCKNTITIQDIMFGAKYRPSFYCNSCKLPDQTMIQARLSSIRHLLGS